MGYINCSKCGYGDIQTDVHLHHLIPRCIGGSDIDGRQYLCKKCHDILHNMLLGQIWKFVPDINKETARQKIKNYSLWWIDQK